MVAWSQVGPNLDFDTPSNKFHLCSAPPGFNLQLNAFPPLQFDLKPALRKTLLHPSESLSGFGHHCSAKILNYPVLCWTTYEKGIGVSYGVETNNGTELAGRSLGWRWASKGNARGKSLQTNDLFQLLTFTWHLQRFIASGMHSSFFNV